MRGFRNVLDIDTQQHHFGVLDKQDEEHFDLSSSR